MKTKPKTIFCDLDGTLVKHPGDVRLIQDPTYELEVLPGVGDFLYQVDVNSYHLVITTGRKESAREATIKQLQRAGILYDQLIMGFGGGDRILINDRKSGKTENTAFAINLTRNEGVKNVKI
jgi:hydroxymethylpyrimidine pyrophosphatase-like HAD family hydrolase|tara:strand:- start:760 stop:1125 length:366 start_codon:yes stop_codon:yes gene_type:complete